MWGCQRRNPAGTALFEHITNSNLILHHPAEPTHYPENGGTPSTLELFIVKGNVNLSEPMVSNGLPSDHVPIICELTDSTARFSASFTHKDYEHANWNQFSSTVANQLINRPQQILTQEDVDASIDLLVQTIKEAENQSIPTKTVIPGKTPLPPGVRCLMRQRNAMNHSWQRTRDTYYKDARDEINQQVQAEIAAVVNNKFATAMENISNDPGPHKHKLWRVVKNFKQRPSGTPQLVENGTKLITDSEKAEAFSRHYHQVFETAANHPNDHNGRKVRAAANRLRRTTVNPDDIPRITLRDVEKEIARLKNRKANGPDQISNRSLKHLPTVGVQFITDIYNACLRLSYFPKSWKMATIITIRKPGKPARETASYRPISLLSALGKLFERVVLPFIQTFIDDNEVIKDHQYGFRTGKSCTHQLFRVSKKIKHSLRTRQTTGILAIDLKAAFDSVWHDALVYKLIQLGCPTYICKLVQSFLEDRYFRVRVGSKLSVEKDIKAGVPQGAVWSPLLFNVYTHDLPQPRDVTIASFADDTAAIATSKRTPTVVNRLQRASNAFSRYFKRWRIQINPSKSEACLFTRKRAQRHRPRRNINVNGTDVPWSSSIRYLGVDIDKTQTFKKHLENKVVKGERMIRVLYPLISRRSKVNTHNKILLFKTIFRPAFTYGCPIWYRCARTHLTKLQRFQNKVLKIMLDLPIRTPTTLVHDLAELELVTPYLTRIAESFEANCLSNINPDIVALIEE